MKLSSLKLFQLYKKDVNSLPNIGRNTTKHNKSEITFNTINNQSKTTKASLAKNLSNSVLELNHLPKLKKLKKIRLNNSMGNIIENTNDINHKDLKLLENADNIIKKRKKTNIFIMDGGQNYSKKYVLRERKEISQKNYTINLLKQKRTEINLKSFLMDQALKNFNSQFQIDYHNFNLFISIKEEDVLGKVQKIRWEKEKILKAEQNLNDSLRDTLVKRLKTFFALRKFGSFFHELISKPFPYDKVLYRNPENSDFEEITNSIIDIYETEEKNMPLPNELNDDDLFDSKCTQLEDMVLFRIRMKKDLEKDMKADIDKYNKELDIIRQIKNQYERDINYFKDEKFLVDLELKKSKLYVYPDFDIILNNISEIGRVIFSRNGGVVGGLPEKNGKDFDEFILFEKKTLNALKDIEIEINNHIDFIEDIIKKEQKKNDNTMKEIILNQKNINKNDFKLSFKQLKEKEKLLKDLKTIEKGRKFVIKGRVIYKYPNIKQQTKKIKKLVIKDDNDEDELHYSETEEEKNK